MDNNSRYNGIKSPFQIDTEPTIPYIPEPLFPTQNIPANDIQFVELPSSAPEGPAQNSVIIIEDVTDKQELPPPPLPTVRPERKHRHKGAIGYPQQKPPYVLEIDPTFTKEGYAADAKLTGELVKQGAIAFNGKLTIQRNGETVQTFTANQATDATADISVPTKVSELDNDEHYATESEIPTEISELNNDVGFITSSDIPTNLSAFNNDVGYITESSIPTDVSAFNNDAGYITQSDVPTDLSDFNNDVGFITSSDIPTNISAFNNDVGYITSADVPTKVSQLQNDSGYITQSAIPTNVSAFTNDAGYAVASTLATVATSGSYTDLLNKPTIPTNADYVDLTTAQEIDGQKDFNTTPRVKIEGEHPREGLPDIYTQLQYVESSGNQYINTGYIISTSTDIVEMTFECIGTTIYKWLFGEHDNNARFGLGVGDGANKRNVAYGSTTYKVNDVLFYNSLHNFKADSTGVFIDNNKIANYSNFSSTSTLALFCLNNDGFVNGTAARIQSYKHTRNGVALIDLVPVIRNSDDKAGFYDFVSESFIGSASSTDLIPGPGLPGPHYENLLTDANFAPVAFTGSYNDLSNTPTTVSSFTNDVGYITSSYHDSTKANQSALNVVTAKIPSEASSSNQLADKAFVNSSIQTATATFLGTYDSIAEIEALTADDNDYAFYRHTDSAGNTLFDRYKYNGTTWLYEYTLNNSSFTSDQWAAINSGVSLGEWVDKSTAQVISGQKDFNTVPRVKVTHETHNLPAEYQEVEYLEATGTQYIDTGFVPTNDNYAFEIDLSFLNTPSTANGYIGYRNVASATVTGNMRYYFIYSDGRMAVRNGVAAENSTWTATLGMKYTISYISKALYQNDSKIVQSSQQSASPTYKSFYLFGINTDGYYSSDLGAMIGKIYECKLYNDDILTNDLIPCYRISDDEPGMYDIVTNTFHTNQGTGDFSVGGDIAPYTYENLLTDANFATVAFTGSYSDLSDKPVNVSAFTNDAGYITSSYHDNTKANQSSLNDVTAKIPSEASSSNQLADKNFVNSSIATATATFLGTYPSVADIESLTADENDYAFYQHTDAAGNTLFERYKYSNSQWLYEYTLNNSSFTADQWAAINSGVSTGEWVDITSAQEIDGQKDFDVTPRVKVTHTVHNLPEGYQELVYIESTGTQYIDTGINLSNNHSIELDYQLTDVAQTKVGLYGGLVNNNRYGTIVSSGGIIEYGYGATNIYYTTVAPDLYRHLIKQEKANIYVDDVLIYTFAPATFTMSSTAYLGGFRYSGYNPAKSRLYIARIWNNDTLVREFIPARNETTEKAGWYDTVNDQFYPSAGSADFIEGPEVYPITYESLLTDANFAPVAFSGSYTDLVNKPSIPTVGNGTITIQKNGTSVGTFTTNQSSAKTINITVPTDNDINTLIDTYMQSHYDNGDTEVY